MPVHDELLKNYLSKVSKNKLITHLNAKNTKLTDLINLL